MTALNAYWVVAQMARVYRSRLGTPEESVVFSSSGVSQHSKAVGTGSIASSICFASGTADASCCVRHRLDLDIIARRRLLGEKAPPVRLDGGTITLPAPRRISVDQPAHCLSCNLLCNLAKVTGRLFGWGGRAELC